MPTPCPHCGRLFPVPREAADGVCPHCKGAVRFVEVPDRPCVSCGKAVPLRPDAQTQRCPHCDHIAATDPEKDVRLRTRCPRCRRALDVPAIGARIACPHCRQSLEVPPAHEQA